MKTNPTPSPAAGSEKLRNNKELFNFIYDSSGAHGDTHADEEAWREKLWQLIDNAITAQNNATYEAVMEAIGSDEVENPMDLPEGENEGYDIKCYMIVSRNKLRANLRQSIAKIFGKAQS